MIIEDIQNGERIITVYMQTFSMCKVLQNFTNIPKRSKKCYGRKLKNTTRKNNWNFFSLQLQSFQGKGLKTITHHSYFRVIASRAKYTLIFNSFVAFLCIMMCVFTESNKHFFHHSTVKYKNFCLSLNSFSFSFEKILKFLMLQAKIQHFIFSTQKWMKNFKVFQFKTIT